MAAAPSAHKQSQFYCVKLHEQPRRGESLFASTERPVYRLEPSHEERGPGERWNPFFKGKEGTGVIFENYNRNDIISIVE